MVRLPEDIVALIAARVLDDDDLKTGQAALACLCRVSKLVNVIATNELYKTLYVDLKHGNELKEGCIVLDTQQYKCLEAVSCLHHYEKVRVIRLSAEPLEKDDQNFAGSVSTRFDWLESRFQALQPEILYFIPIFKPCFDMKATLESGQRLDAPEIDSQQMLLELLFVPRLVNACASKLKVLKTTVLPFELLKRLGQADNLESLAVSCLPWTFLIDRLRRMSFQDQGHDVLAQMSLVFNRPLLEDVNSPISGLIESIFKWGGLATDRDPAIVSTRLTKLTVWLDFTSGMYGMRSWFSELEMFLTRRAPTIQVVHFDGLDRMPALAYMWALRYEVKNIVDFMTETVNNRARPLVFSWNAEFWTPVEIDELKQLIEQAKNKGHDLHVVFEGKPMAKPGGRMRRGEAQHRG